MGNPFKFLGKAFGNPIVQQIAVGAVAGFAPALAPLVHTSLSAVIAAEAKFPSQGSGAQRAAWASEVVAVSAAPMIASIEAATGKELVDEGLFHQGLESINQGVVQCLNAFRVLPKG